MNKIKKKLKAKLLGHLSDCNTKLDVLSAYEIVKDSCLSFSVFCAEYTFGFSDGLWRMKTLFPTFKTSDEIFELWRNID